jgi:upstream activation factor subunit UAF30
MLYDARSSKAVGAGSGSPGVETRFKTKGESNMAKAKAKAKANSAFMKPLKVSEALVAVVGKGPLPRSEVVKKLWIYIKKNKLQDEKNKRNINADASLKVVFGGKKVVNMFEMTKLVSKHLS